MSLNVKSKEDALQTSEVPRGRPAHKEERGTCLLCMTELSLAIEHMSSLHFRYAGILFYHKTLGKFSHEHLEGVAGQL